MIKMRNVCFSIVFTLLIPATVMAEPVSVPVNQILQPAGLQVDLSGLRPQVIALSPDGKILATSGKTGELIVLTPDTGKILQRVALPSDSLKVQEAVSPRILAPDRNGQVSYNGLVFSPDGSRLYLSAVNGSIKVFGINAHHIVQALGSFVLAPHSGRHHASEIPTGLALSPDGKKLYVALNVANQLAELEAATGKILREFNVGNLPYGVVLANGKIYVSYWGGRRVDATSFTGKIGSTGTVRVDARHIANEGSVTIVDLTLGKVKKEIMVGLHPSAVAVSPDGRHMVVANDNSDSVTVIDTRTDEIVETISLRWHDGDLFGASPNALTFDAKGKNLYVCNGGQNAVAVVAFDPGKSKILGLIPTGWFPGAITYDAERRAVYVANIKGKGSGQPDAEGHKGEFNSHQFFGTLSLIPLGGKSELEKQTTVVLESFRREVIEQAMLPPRADAKPKPVPERSSEPSPIKHVIYIIKENRTYDQVLGDMKEGNGNSDLCVFGERVTPNQHKMSREFVLLDNTCCSGVLSADGHQWCDESMATAYMEKSFCGFPRSYPDGMDGGVDSMAYSPAGFIWDNVLSHGQTMRNYGEFTSGGVRWRDPKRKGEPSFVDAYQDFLKGGNQTVVYSRANIPTFAPYLATNSVGWSMEVPDVFRAAKFSEDLKRFEHEDAMPNFIIMCLPNDHTSGTRERGPTPAARVADNDLAMGQILEALSHSIFWKDTCLFAIEDDPQAGWDHVSSYRTTAYVASAYTKRHTTIHHSYNQTSVIRTMELILGLPPMNQMDASATPMFECFTDVPDLTPFNAVPNQIPLDQLNPLARNIGDPQKRLYALTSNRLPLREADKCPEDLLNRILWNAQKGSAPYPVWAITPGAKDADD